MAASRSGSNSNLAARELFRIPHSSGVILLRPRVRVRVRVRVERVKAGRRRKQNPALEHKNHLAEGYAGSKSKSFNILNELL